MTHLLALARPECEDRRDTWTEAKQSRAFQERSSHLRGVTMVRKRVYAPDPRRLAGTALSVRHAPLRRPPHTHTPRRRNNVRPPARLKLCDRVRRLRCSPPCKPIDTLSILSHTRTTGAGRPGGRAAYIGHCGTGQLSCSRHTHTRLHIAGCRIKRQLRRSPRSSRGGLTLACRPQRPHAGLPHVARRSQPRA